MAILDDLIALLNADWFERFQAHSASFMLPTIQWPRDETVTIRGDGPPLDYFGGVDTGELRESCESVTTFDGRVMRTRLLREQPQTLGDTSCANNARSPYLRCAINPCGPCDGCKSFEEMSYE
jgi:hypothetical protein